MKTYAEAANARRDERQSLPDPEPLGTRPATQAPKGMKRHGIACTYRISFRNKLTTWTQWYSTERARDEAFRNLPKSSLATLPEFRAEKVDR